LFADVVGAKDRSRSHEIATDAMQGSPSFSDWRVSPVVELGNADFRRMRLSRS
jgi:hypothetical protein